MASPPSLKSRIRGAFTGLAVVDALGGPVEFKRRGSFPLVTGMLPNSNFHLPPGCFTDDTSMALCLAQSLIENNGKHNSLDQVQKYLAWRDSGYMSCVGHCFDIEVSTRRVLYRWNELLAAEYNHLQPGSVAAATALKKIESSVWSEQAHEQACGNGSLMRVLPTALIAESETNAVQLARDSSKTTHSHPRCVDACGIYAQLVWHALSGSSKEDLAGSLATVIKGEQSESAIEPVLGQRLRSYETVSDWNAKPRNEIRSTGYVVDSFEASLWAFFTTASFKKGEMRAVNLGDDADTVGAIYGGLAGAFYGVDAIPENWTEKMQMMDMLETSIELIVKHRGSTVS